MQKGFKLLLLNAGVVLQGSCPSNLEFDGAFWTTFESDPWELTIIL